MKKQKYSSREKAWMSAVVLLLFFAGLFAVISIHWYTEYNRLNDNNYCVPQGYSAVYYRLDSSGVAIVVFDIKDNIQAQMVAQINEYMSQRSRSIINNTQGGAE